MAYGDGAEAISRLLVWNIRQGGGPRVPAIVRAVRRLNPDVAVLTEFRNGRTGAQLKSAMATAGYPHMQSSAVRGVVNGVALFSRRLLVPVRLPASRREWRGRLACARIGGTTYVAAYFPIGGPKIALFDWFLAAFGRLAGQRTVLMGDFNTGLHFEDESGASFVAPEGMLRLREAGYSDAWRTLYPKRREFTWFSPQAHNGFRLDYVFLGAPLAKRLVSARHVQGVRERRVSDHAALVVELG